MARGTAYGRSTKLTFKVSLSRNCVDLKKNTKILTVALAEECWKFVRCCGKRSGYVVGGQSGCGEEWENSLLRGRRRPRQPLERDARGSHSVSGAGLQACACGAGREARGVSWTGRWQLQGPV